MIAKIKQQADILDVCDRLGLDPNRSGFISCPIHGEDSTPSLKIYPEDNSWHCFGCGEFGDAIDLVKAVVHIDNPQTIRMMCEWYGIKNEPLNWLDRMRFDADRIKREHEKQAKQREEEAYQEIVDRLYQIDAAMVNNQPGTEKYIEAMINKPHAEYALEVAQFERKQRLGAAIDKHRSTND